MKNIGENEKFDEGFATALSLFVQEHGENYLHHCFRVFDNAGYTLSDFERLPLDPIDRDSLNQIFAH